MINRTLEERLEELTTRLNRLTLQQDDINIRVIHTRKELATLIEAIQASTATTTTTTTPVASRNESRRTVAVAGSGYYVGDRVTIINPSPGQEDQGVIIGETRDKLLKIKPSLGKYIKMLPKNVKK